MVVEVRAGNRFALTDKLLELLQQQGVNLDPNCTVWLGQDDPGMTVLMFHVDLPAPEDPLIGLDVVLWLDRSLLTEEYLRRIES